MLFLRTYEVLALHARAIEEFGGLDGMRHAGALEAALMAVENRAYYEQASLSTCAATYAYHLTQSMHSWTATNALPQRWRKSFSN